jgi:transcriptional regulator with XRE-family HTH domain
MDTDNLEISASSVLDGLGDRIRGMRLERSMTLQELSQASQVSVAMLSHIERSRSTPSIKVLDRIRTALNVSFSSFFEELADTSPVSKAAVVTRSNERPLLRFDATGLVKELLSPARGTHMEMMMLNLQPGGYSGEEPWRREGEKCGLVLEGSFELKIGNQIYILNENDAFQFDSAIPHSFRNMFDGVSKVLWIILSKDFG